ncbi:hypothetical protein PCASD_20091, partial [Puccinia coronata f. sp. avenae]
SHYNLYIGHHQVIKSLVFRKSNMKNHSFALIITILLSVLAFSTGKIIPIFNKNWVRVRPYNNILNKDEWSSRAYVDLTGNCLPKEVGAGTEPQLKVSRGSFVPKNVYLTNVSSQKQTYLLVNEDRKRWLLMDIEPKDIHMAVMAGDVHVYVKRPESEDAHVQPEHDSSNLESPNEGHDGPNVDFSPVSDLTTYAQALSKEKYPDGSGSGSHADGDLREELKEGITVSQ